MSSAEVFHFPRVIRESSSSIPIVDPQLDLYDSSREGTESLPQLARTVLLTMLRQEEGLVKIKRSDRDRKYTAANVREIATTRFLEFVAGNEAMSSLDTDFLAGLTERSPEAISRLFQKEQRKSA